MTQTRVRVSAHADMTIAVTSKQMSRYRTEQREDKSRHQADCVDRLDCHNSSLVRLLAVIKNLPARKASRKRQAELTPTCFARAKKCFTAIFIG